MRTSTHEKSGAKREAREPDARDRGLPSSAPSPLARVLVPTDFSKGADLALERALMLPLAPGAKLELLSVIPPMLPAQTREKLEQDLTHRLAHDAERVQKARKAAKDSEITITTRVRVGQPFVEIIRCSRELDAELVVLGKHGRRAVRDLLLGTTVEKIIRHGDVPVLVVARKPVRPYRRPLLATALDDASLRLSTLLQRLLEPTVERGFVVHAYHVPFAGFVSPVPSSKDRAEWDAAFRGEAEGGLRAVVTHLQACGLRWKAALHAGDPRTVIMNEAESRRADLLAMGTHARSGIVHALLGSVAEWLVSEARCDVLIARPVRFTYKAP